MKKITIYSWFLPGIFLLVSAGREVSGVSRNPFWETGMVTSGAVTIVLTIATLAKLAVKQDVKLYGLGAGFGALTYLVCTYGGNQTWSSL